MTRRCLSFAFVAVVLAGAMAAAQAQAPVVTMSITTPDGRTHELTAAESGLATRHSKMVRSTGSVPRFRTVRPGIESSSTIFRSATASAPTTVLGEIELRRGGPAVNSKTNPSSRCPFPRCRLQQRSLSRG
jgi:hypothetical protein